MERPAGQLEDDTKPKENTVLRSEEEIEPESDGNDPKSDSFDICGD